jgi:cystathionine gamma-synthase
MTKDPERAPSTLAAQGLGWIDEASKGLIPPLQLSTTYIRDPDNEYSVGYSYSRSGNPTYEQPQALIARLEGGEAALLFASGSAAAGAVFAALEPGDHIVAPKVMYYALRNWMQARLTGWGLEFSFVDAQVPDAIAAAIQPGRTKLVWVETPANPTWEVTDIATAADSAHAGGARLAVDSTVGAAVLTHPIALGADIVMHSATKYLNGHSDVVAGALVTARRDDFWDRIVQARSQGGAVLGPVEAWLLMRGMRTLPLRIERASRSAQIIAEHFNADPRILAVLYPGLSSHPGHAVARRQMRGGFGGMLSLRVRGGEAAAIAAAAQVALWKRATSLGGVESLIEHRASTEGVGTSTPGDLLRLSVGLEDPEDLIADLDQALGKD